MCWCVELFPLTATTCTASRPKFLMVGSGYQLLATFVTFWQRATMRCGHTIWGRKHKNCRGTLVNVKALCIAVTVYIGDHLNCKKLYLIDSCWPVNTTNVKPAKVHTLMQVLWFESHRHLVVGIVILQFCELAHVHGICCSVLEQITVFLSSPKQQLRVCESIQTVAFTSVNEWLMWNAN